MWKEFTEGFLDYFLPLEIREAKVDEFTALKLNDMSVMEYPLSLLHWLGMPQSCSLLCEIEFADLYSALSRIWSMSVLLQH